MSLFATIQKRLPVSFLANVFLSKYVCICDINALHIHSSQSQFYDVEDKDDDMILFQSYQAQAPSKPGNLVTGKKRAAVTVRWALLSAASQLPRPSCVENEGHIAIIAIKLPWSFFVVIFAPSQLGNLASPHQIQLHRNHLSIAPCQLLPIVNRSSKAVKVMILGQLWKKQPDK